MDFEDIDEEISLVVFQRAVVDASHRGGEAMRLVDRVAVVTGGGSGIGKAICEVYAQEGAKVVINDLELATAEATRKGLSGSGHLAEATEIATTALYLASDDSSYVTGQWISPNGGIHIQ